jgi:acyl-coenzyme A thioesterase PaaI-like protein
MATGPARSADADTRPAFFESPMARWLRIEPAAEPHRYRMRFAEYHIGNPFIRSLHGGVVGSMIEVCAELDLASRLPQMYTVLVSAAIDYLRVTRDADLYASVEEVRIARRLAFMNVWCWQDDEALPVARGACTLRITADAKV